MSVRDRLVALLCIHRGLSEAGLALHDDALLDELITLVVEDKLDEFENRLVEYYGEENRSRITRARRVVEECLAEAEGRREERREEAKPAEVRKAPEDVRNSTITLLSLKLSDLIQKILVCGTPTSVEVSEKVLHTLFRLAKKSPVLLSQIVTTYLKELTKDMYELRVVLPPGHNIVVSERGLEVTVGNRTVMVISRDCSEIRLEL